MFSLRRHGFYLGSVAPLTHLVVQGELQGQVAVGVRAWMIVCPLCGQAMNWRPVQGATRPLPYDSWVRPQLTPWPWDGWMLSYVCNSEGWLGLQTSTNPFCALRGKIKCSLWCEVVRHTIRGTLSKNENCKWFKYFSVFDASVQSVKKNWVTFDRF